MAWRPYFSYPHYENRHVNQKYAKNSRHHKKTVKKLDVRDLSEFRRFQFSSLGIKILSKKKNFVRPAFDCPTYAKKPQEILPQNIDSPRNKSNFSLEGQNTEISQKQTFSLIRGLISAPEPDEPSFPIKGHLKVPPRP